MRNKCKLHSYFIFNEREKVGKTCNFVSESDRCVSNFASLPWVAILDLNRLILPQVDKSSLSYSDVDNACSWHSNLP